MTCADKPSAKHKKAKKCWHTSTLAGLLTDWQWVAKQCAEDAGENLMSSRRGAFYLPNQRAVCILNNHPYSNPKLREKETAYLRDLLKKAGMRELSDAVYPESGEDAGYTHVMIVVASEAELVLIDQMIFETCMKAW